MQNITKAFLKIYFTLINRLVFKSRPVSIRGWIVAVFLLGYLGCGFEFFYFSFKFIHSFPIVGDLLLDRLWHFFFFILWIMLIFSNAIVGYMAHYKSPEINFLLSLPISPRSIFFKQLFEGMILSSWGFLFLASPMMVAFGIVLNGSFLYYPSAIIFLMPYIFLASVLGSCLIFIVIMINRLKKRKIFLGLIAALMGIALMNFFRFPTDLAGDSEYQILSFLRNFLDGLAFSRSPYIPTTWLAKGLILISNENLKEGMFFLGLMVSTGLLFADILYFFTGRKYALFWEWAQGGRQRQGQSFISKIFMHLRAHAMIKKDILCIVRDPAQWIQLVVLGAMMILYIGNLKSIHGYVDHPYWENLIYFMNLTAIGLMMATLALRFVYPQFSLEWRRSWIIGLIPMKYQEWMKKKFYFYCVSLLVISQILSYLSNMMLESGIYRALLSGWISAMISMGVTALSFSLGVFYPNFQTENISRIMSGLGGVLNLVVSMAYLIVMLLPVSVPFHYIALGRLEISGIVCFYIGGLIVLMSLISIGLSCLLLKRVIEKPCPE